jgi:hypothetical protein
MQMSSPGLNDLVLSDMTGVMDEADEGNDYINDIMSQLRTIEVSVRVRE